MKELSDNQKQFVKDAEEQGFEVDYDYSGRGMYGVKCPSIDVNDLLNDFHTTAHVDHDNMGRGYVIYASR